MKTLLYVVVASLFISAWLPPAYCSEKPVGKATGEDIIPYIKCQVCEKFAKQLYIEVENKKAEILTKKLPNKISEYIIEIAENVCNPWKAEAGWILQTDIVEKGDKLELVEKKGSEGQCNSECKTIKQACYEVKEYHTHVAKYLYNYKHDLDSFIEYFCKGQACSTKPPPVPKGKVHWWNKFLDWCRGEKAGTSKKGQKTGKSEL